MAVTVTLEPFEYEWATHVAVRRMTARATTTDAPHYQNDHKQDELRATIATCCCEIAAARVYNRYWAGHAWHATEHGKYRNLADVGQNIEVRRVREPTNPFGVDQNDVRAGRTMVAAYAHEPDYRTVTVYGHMPAAEAWERGDAVHWGKTHRRAVQLGYLTPINGTEATAA